MPTRLKSIFSNWIWPIFHIFPNSFDIIEFHDKNPGITIGVCRCFIFTLVILLSVEVFKHEVQSSGAPFFWDIVNYLYLRPSCLFSQALPIHSMLDWKRKSIVISEILCSIWHFVHSLWSESVEELLISINWFPFTCLESQQTKMHFPREIALFTRWSVAGTKAYTSTCSLSLWKKMEIWIWKCLRIFLFWLWIKTSNAWNHKY